MERTANETHVPVLAKLIGLVLAMFSTLVAVGIAHPEKALAADIPSTATITVGTMHPYPSSVVGTRDYYYNGTRAYCFEPQKLGFGGTYPTMTLEDGRNIYHTTWSASSIRAAMYHSYGLPGFNKAQWPTMNWRGTPMTDADYIIASHIVLSDLVSANGDQAMSGGDQNFKDWVGNNLLAYYQGSGPHEDHTQWQITYDDDVPSSFQAFLVNPNTATQGFIAYRFIPTAKLTIDKETSIADGVYSVIVQGNDLYSLSGAEYGVYSDAGATNQIGTVTTGADGVSDKIEVTVTDLDDGSTVYYKELKAPAGYALDSTVYSTTLTAGEDTTTSAMDIPHNIHSDVTVDKDTVNIIEAEGNTSLAGATYRIEYYDVDTSNVSSNDMATTLAGKAPLASAEFQTGSDGQLHFADAKAVNGTTWAYTSNGQNFMPVGTMRITEVKAPAGYELDKTPRYASLSAAGDGEHDVIVTDPETGTSNVKSVEPVKYVGTVSGEKQDSDAKASYAQGDAKLDATYSLYNNSVNGDGGKTGDGSVFYGGKKVASAKGTTEANLMATVKADAKTGAWKFTDLPYGTYTVKETKAATGYLLDSDWSYTFTIDEGHRSVTPERQNADDVIRGGLSVGKAELESMTYDAQGASSLDGAEFTVYNYSAHDVWTLNGTRVGNHQPYATLSTKATDDGHIAATAVRDLPYGTYVVRETKAPEGHELNNGYSFTVEVRADGTVYHYDTIANGTNDKSQGSAATNQVFREDFNFTKKGSSDKDRMANVAFMVTSDTTGESHVIVTDENGFYNSSASFNKHTTNTNANDAAVTKADDGSYVVDESKLDASAGTWFYGYANGSDDAAKVKVNNGLSAFPYDIYTVTELPSSANEGKELVTFHLTMHRDNYSLDYGTVYDDTVGIHTQAENPDTGTQTASAAEKCVISDAVNYEGLTAGKGYTLTGTLHIVNEDGSDGGVIKDAAGNDVTATKDFTPASSSGIEHMTFTFDASKLQGKTTVVFEDVYSDGVKVAAHANISDENQTVRFPSVHTTATAEDGSKVAPASETATIVDTVAYDNLTVGESYTVSGTLHLRDADGNDAGTVKDASGNDVVASKSFVASEKSGTVEVEFSFDASQLQGRTVVVFEDLMQDAKTLATHANISDENQTVRFPSVHTTLTDTASPSPKMANATSHVSLTDTVAYSGLEVGKEYTMSGTLHLRDADGNDAGVVKDAAGKEVTATKTFTPKSADGTVEVTFDFDAPKLAGSTVVAFETVSHDGIDYATHADISDEGQTVRLPKVTSVMVANGLKETLASDDVSLVDTVKLANAEDGTYGVEGYLHVIDPKGNDMGILLTDGTVYDSALDKVSEIPAIDPHATDDESQTKGGIVAAADGSAVDVAPAVDLTNEKVPENAVTGTGTIEVKDGAGEGSADVTFEFDGSALAGYKVVAFEKMFAQNDDGSNAKAIGTGCDLTDVDETVSFPQIGTTLTGDGGEKEVDSKVIDFTDTVDYSNLTPGKEYVMHGQLVTPDGDDVKVIAEAETKFTASETGSGSVDVVFEGVDVSNMAGQKVVAFEDVRDGDIVVASHADIEDEGQTVKVRPDTPPTPNESKPDDKPSQKSGSAPTSMPHLGNNPMAIIALVIVAAAAVAGGVTFYRQKRGNKD